MRQVTKKNVEEFVDYVINNYLKIKDEFNVIIHDDKYGFNVDTGEDKYETFVFIEEKHGVLNIQVIGTVLDIADQKGIPIDNEVEEFAFICDYISSELLSIVNKRIQTGYLTKLGLFEEVPVRSPYEA